LACRTALARHGVAHINFPVDTQSLAVTAGERSPRNIPDFADTQVYAARAALPAAPDVKRAAEVLNAGNKVAILAGRGALGATDELIALADTLGAPIIKPLLGKACVPDDSPYTTGGIGLLGTLPSEETI